MIFPDFMSYIIDMLVVAIFLFCVVRAFRNGFVYELINFIFLGISILAGWFLSPILAIKASLFNIELDNELAAKLIDSNNISIVINTVVWFIIIVLVLNLLFVLIKPVFKALTKVPVLGSINKLLGGILGLIRAFIICLLLSVLITLPVIKNGKDIKNNSILRFGDDITNITTKFLVDNVDLDNLKHEISSFDADAARNDLQTWLIQQGVLNE